MNYEPFAAEMYAVLKAITGNKHVDLDGLVYAVRDREMLGWDGPATTAWGEACAKLNDLMKRIATAEKEAK